MSVMRTSKSRGVGSAEVTGFYDPATGSVQYVAADPETAQAALIDVVHDFDSKAARFSTESAEAILRFVEETGLEMAWILDTHPHADHMMASAWLKDRLGAPNGIGEKVLEIADLWRGFYGTPDAFDPTADFDRLFADGDTFQIGSLPVRVMLSPGHTLGSISYVVGEDAALVHDTFMHPDSGTSRCDFPGGSAADLYASLQAILALPDNTRLFVGHDYCGGGRSEPAWESTVAEQRASNAHIGGGVSEADFVAKRETRDATLSLPTLMLHALQVNLRAGRWPDDGSLRIPVNKF